MLADPFIADDYLGEDLRHRVDSLLEGLLADGQDLVAVGGEVAAKENVHQVNLKGAMSSRVP